MFVRVHLPDINLQFVYQQVHDFLFLLNAIDVIRALQK